jgi:uncharacterized protein with PIN domain
LSENASNGDRAAGDSSADRASGGTAIPRFLVDGTVGKLARWLRVLGFDAAYVSECEAAAIARLARQSGRTVLTRSREVADRLGGSSILIESEHLRGQLEQVVESAGRDACRPFSRCNVCNRRLERVDKETVRGRVPEFVYATQESFSTCPECGRYFWHGTHYANMLEQVRLIVEGDQDESE